MKSLLLLFALSLPALAQIPGYNVPTSGVGLTVCIGPGSNTINGTVVKYAGSCLGPLALNTTTFGYIDTITGNLLTNTTGAPSGSCPIFEADTNQFFVTAVRDKRPSMCGGGGSATATTINSISGTLISDANGTKLMFIAKPPADPAGNWIWFGADIPLANIGLFNYDMVIDDVGNSVGQRNIKLQAHDDVTLQSSTGASSSPFDCGRNNFNGGCEVQGNLVMNTPNTGLPAGAPGFNDSIVLSPNAHSPTSAGTAGKTGELVWDGTNLYLCTSGGAAGAATWKKLVLAAD